MSESLADIARKLNVAPSTISRALSNPDKVAAKTRERILSYIEQVGYRPNQQARNLRMQRSNTLGIVVNDLGDGIISNAANIMQDVASQRGYFPVLLLCDESRTKERASIERLLMSNVCGLVIIPSSATAELLPKLNNIPVVELDRSTDTNFNDEFRMDDKAAMQMASRYLIEQGCKHIAVIIGNVNRISSFKMRNLALSQCDPRAHYTSFCVKAVKAADMKISARYLTACLLSTLGPNAQPLPHESSLHQHPDVKESEPTMASNDEQDLASAGGMEHETYPNFASPLPPLSFEHLQELLLPEFSHMEYFANTNTSASAANAPSLPPIDGIIAANNSLAAGIVQGFNDQGVAINKDIKLFVFDNPDWLAVLPYRIATISHPLDKAASLAINRLIDRIEKKYTELPEARLLRPRLIPV